MKRKIIGGIIIGCFVLLVVGIPLLSKIIYPDNMSNKNCSNSEEVQAYKMAQKKRAFKNEIKKLSREINFPHNLYMKTHPKLQDKAVADLLCKEAPGTDITPDNITRGDLEKIRSLSIGCENKTCNTIEDIALCPNLLELQIDLDCEKDITELKSQLKDILPRLSNLKILSLSAANASDWDSLDFLKNCNQIEDIYISGYENADVIQELEKMFPKAYISSESDETEVSEDEEN